MFSVSSAIFAKGNNFCEFLFASLDIVALPKWDILLTLMHSEWPKLHRVLAFLSAIGLKEIIFSKRRKFFSSREARQK